MGRLRKLRSNCLGIIFLKMATASKTKKKSVNKRRLSYGLVHILASTNNTIVTVTDPEGETVAWASAGSCGFKGSRKSTPYAAQVAAEKAADTAKAMGLEEIDIYIKGIGNGREQAVRGLIAKDLQVNKIVDRTPVPHNGCRKKRPRRN